MAFLLPTSTGGRRLSSHEGDSAVANRLFEDLLSQLREAHDQALEAQKAKYEKEICLFRLQDNLASTPETPASPPGAYSPTRSGEVNLMMDGREYSECHDDPVPVDQPLEITEKLNNYSSSTKGRGASTESTSPTDEHLVTTRYEDAEDQEKDQEEIPVTRGSFASRATTITEVGVDFGAEDSIKSTIGELPNLQHGRMTASERFSSMTASTRDRTICRPSELESAFDEDGNLMGNQMSSKSGSQILLSNLRSLTKGMRLRQSWTDHPALKESGDLSITAQTFGLAFAPSAAAPSELKKQSSSYRPLPKATGCGRCVASPGANWRLAWDLSGAGLIGYDTVAIPFQMSFQPSQSAFLTFVDWFTMIFWTLDMIFTFFVGYMSMGQQVMAPSRIAKRYLSTWFVLDVLVVAGDWFNNLGELIGLSGSGGGAFASLGKLMRSLRFIRVLRLLRLLKLRKLLADLQDHITSEYTYLLVSLTKLLCFILFLNHGIACIWYYVGRKSCEIGDCWIVAADIKRKGLAYEYTTALHWTLTQFTPASMEVFPQSTPERTMSVIVLMFALVAFSSFVGSISTSMTALRNMNSETDKQFWLLRRYLKQVGLPKHVSRRVIKYLEYIVEKKQGKVQPAKIGIISMLSEQLREELTYELTKPKLMGHVFFELFAPTMEVIMRKLTTTALSMRIFATGDTLFYLGEEATTMFCNLTGELEYQVGSQVLEPPVQELEWIAEPVLWVPWKHLGKLRAVAETEVITVSAEKFIEVMRGNIAPWSLASTYAATFLELFKEMEPTDIIRADDQFRMDLVDMLEEANPFEFGPGCRNFRTSRSDQLARRNATHRISMAEVAKGRLFKFNK